MKLKEKLFVCVLLILLSPTFLFSQAKPSRQASIDEFSKGNYEQAYNQFGRLLETYPRDPLYKFYSAACLIELKREPAKAEELLNQALGSSSLKSLPNEVLFYLGRARQLQGNYKEAEKAYNRFTQEAGRKEARDLNVPEYIIQCRQNSGKLSAEAVPAAAVLKNSPETRTLPDTSGKAARGKEPLGAGADAKLGEVLDRQFREDSLAALSKTAKPVPEVPKTVVAENMPVKPVVDTTNMPASKPVAKPVAAPKGQDTVRASVPVQEKSKPVQAETPDTTIKIKTISSTGSLLSVFEVLPKAVTDPKEKIAINPEIPDGLVYRIQAAVFKNPVTPAYFRGLSPVYGFKAPGSAVTIYYVGVFRKMTDAVKALSAVRAKGFRDAFVIAQMDGKNVSAERATVFEKDWGNRSLFRVSNEEQEQAIDTIPPALVFRVEVARSPKPLNDEVVNEMRKIAGNRPFDIQPMDDNTIAYLIGNFITYESANEYASLLIKNGYGDSKVVAWLGKKQIDVETAKRLFDSLK